MEGRMKVRMIGLMVGQTNPSLWSPLDYRWGSNNYFEKDEILPLKNIYHIY